MTASLNLNYVHSRSLGYGRLGCELDTALRAKGVTVYDGVDSPDPRDVAAQRVGERTYGQAETVCWVSTPSHARGWWKGQRPVLFSMFESMRLPESFRANLHNFDTVIVPSPQNVELFGRYHPNVKLATLGVDPEAWHYVPREMPGATFNFLIGGSGPRKGTDLAHKAFRRVFPAGSWGDGPIPTITFKSPRNEPYYGDRVQVIGGKLPADEEVALYEQAHCYLQPSRGEGFGLQPLQAMAQGCPTILTDAHGHESFAHLGHGISATPAEAGYFLFGDAGDWWEPSLDELCEQMRFVYDNYEACVLKAKAAAAVVASEFTWANCADHFLTALGGIDTLRPFVGTDEWIKPDEQLFTVRVNRPWRCDIAGTCFYLEPGMTYWQTADVKRVLFEAEVLDPACITEDSGLLPVQIDDLERYKAERSWCPTCDQRLGSGEHRSTQFMAAGA